MNFKNYLIGFLIILKMMDIENIQIQYNSWNMYNKVVDKLEENKK